jgi:protein-disulfide isomerase
MQEMLSVCDFHGRWLQMKKLISVLSMLMLTAGASFANEPGSHPWLDARLKERRYRCPAGASPFRGPADAPVTITEFIDYECPYCGQEEDTLKKVLKAYPTQVKLVVKNLPRRNCTPTRKGKRS